MNDKLKPLHNNRGGVDQHVQTAVILLLLTACFYFVIETAVLFTSVIKINNTAELMAKEIQLSGTVSQDTSALLNNALENSRLHNYTASVTIHTGGGERTVTVTPDGSAAQTVVQLGSAYTVITKAQTKFLFGEKIIKGKAVGISEVYTK